MLYTLHHVTETVWAADWNEPGCKNNVSTLYSQGCLLDSSNKAIGWPMSYIYLRRLSVSDDVLLSEGLWKSRMSMGT